MTRDVMALRGLVILAACALAAVAVGYLLATPMAFSSYAPIGFGFALMLFPLVMRWHHPLLIMCWNATLIVFFLPGQPSLATILAFLSLGVSLLDRTMGRLKFLRTGGVGWPLILIAIVVLVTALLSGGLGGRALGSELWGARRYLGVFGAVVGFFAITARAIPPERIPLLAAIFFLSGATAIGSDVAYFAGPSFYFLFSVFSSDVAFLQVVSKDSLIRFTGAAWFALAVFYFMLMRYGIRGVLSLTRPWRLATFLIVVIVGLFGGYRSSVVIMAIIFAVQFYLEGLFRTRVFPAVVLSLMFLLSLAAPFANKMPLSVQRSLSFLPLDIDPSAKIDAEGTIEWRLTVWKAVVPEIPRYLFLGKGYAYSSTDFNLTQEAVRRGVFSAIEDTLVSGNYHNGFLTLIIPFGLVGFFGFCAFCWAGTRTLYRNYRFGDERFVNINRFLYAFFIGRLVFYFVFYGQFDLDLGVFTGTVAFSIAMNRGIARPAAPSSAVSDQAIHSAVEPALATEAC